MDKLFYRMLVFLAVGLLSGCSGKLSERDAEKVIKEKIKFPLINYVEIEYGLISYDLDSLPKYYYILQEKGMFHIEHLGERGLLNSYYVFRVTPTLGAKKFIIKEISPPRKQGTTGEFMYNSSFKTSETQFEKILSIHEVPSINAADVRYNVRTNEFTPFWNYYSANPKSTPDTIGSRTFGMIKTNDGWGSAK
jgi:hypothetical protein